MKKSFRALGAVAVLAALLAVPSVALADDIVGGGNPPPSPDPPPVTTNVVVLILSLALVH